MLRLLSSLLFGGTVRLRACCRDAPLYCRTLSHGLGGCGATRTPWTVAARGIPLGWASICHGRYKQEEWVGWVNWDALGGASG